MSYVLVFFGAYILGVITSAILLSKKGLETYKKLSEETSNTATSSIKAAKEIYKNRVKQELEQTENNEK